jgi:hypothetical protein
MVSYYDYIDTIYLEMFIEHRLAGTELPWIKRMHYRHFA